MANLRKRRHSAGVSLIEALVAMAVMAFGMLGMVGVESTLRLNADVSKQRSEAVRLAQREVENWRAYTQLELNTATVDYNTDIVSDAGASSIVDTGATNTTYTLLRDVQATADPRMKTLRVRVDWIDRSSAPQRVELNSVIAGVPPALPGTLLIAANVDASGVSTIIPGGRHRDIPPLAVDLGNGSSGFMPPQAAGGGQALVFDNVTGFVKLCETTATSTSQLTAVNVRNCSTDPGQFVSGYVRFAQNAGTAPSAAVAESPTDTALDLNVAISLTSSGNPAPGSICFDDSRPVPTTATIVNYYCVVFSNTQGEWSGISSLSILSALSYKVCRYTSSATDLAPNRDHPREYMHVVSGELLTNQNFLVVAGNATCPTDVAANPAIGDFVNSNTRQHQP